MRQLTFMDVSSYFADYMSNTDYGDCTPTVAEFEGVIYD